MASAFYFGIFDVQSETAYKLISVMIRLAGRLLFILLALLFFFSSVNLID